jgi:hypothetical protein
LYGEELTFTGSEFTVAGLVAGDEVTSVTLTSAGAAATAPVGHYSIVPSDPQGIGLQNYNFTFVNGLLIVDGVFLTLPSQLVPSRLLMSSGTEVTLASCSPAELAAMLVAAGRVIIQASEPGCGGAGPASAEAIP